MNIKAIIKKAIKYLFYFITIVQVILGLLWVIRNLGHVYMWPETAEYLDIAGNYVIDEYVGIIYPLLVKTFYYIPLYLIQLVMAGASSFLLLYKAINLERNDAIWGSLYLISFPSLLLLHLSIRPESLRLSMVLFAITFLTYKKRSVVRYAIVALALVILVVSSSIISAPGSRGRIQKTFWSLAFMRVCTEFYSQSFVAWDDRTLDTYEIEDALELIKKSDNMMYEIGPTMDSKWGFEDANDSYKFMVKKCLGMRTKGVLEVIGTDLGQSIILPFGFVTENNGTSKTQTGRYYEAFLTNRSSTDSFYWFYSVWGLTLILALGIIHAAINFKSLGSLKVSYELLAAALLQWLYRTLTTGDAIDYAKYILVIAGWIVLAIHLTFWGTKENDRNEITE